MTAATVSGPGGACNDGNPCTAGETCQSGSCVGGAPSDLDLDTHVDALCGGDDCNDADPTVWNAPSEVADLVLGAPTSADLAWGSQSASAGPETVYDLVSGSLIDAGSLTFSAASCLQAGIGNSYVDGRPDPQLGETVWYLARARNSCGSGTFGSAARDAAIPACP
jgi:hypothetical protein